MRQSVSGTPTGRPHSLRSADASLRSWRLPDLFFLFGIPDGRDWLEPRQPPPAGVRAPHRACGTVLRAGGGGPAGPPPLLCVFRWFDPVRSVASLRVQAGGILAYPSGRAYRPALPAPSAEGAGGGAERRAVGVSVEGWPCVTPPCEERGAAARRDEHFRPDDDRRVPSRSWSSTTPDRRRRSGRRHDRRECGLPVAGLNQQHVLKQALFVGNYPSLAPYRVYPALWFPCESERVRM